MVKKLFSLIFLACFVGFSSAQTIDYRSAPLKKNSNYYEIVNQVNAQLSPLFGKTDRKSKKKLKQFRRWAAFWKDRVLPDGSFVSAAHDYKEWQVDNIRQSQFRQASMNTQWTLVGPAQFPTSTSAIYPGMGRINTVAFNGTDTNTLYVGSPAGGVWKSTNGGTTWVPKGDNFPNMGVSNIVIDPSNANVLYLATGDWDGQHNRSLGILKSTNAGDTWTQTGLTFTLGQNDLISKLLIDPNNTNTIFATTRNSIKRSTNGGTTWTDVFTETGALFNDIQYKTGSNAVLYATSKLGKFYTSSNNGNSWSVTSTITPVGQNFSSRVDIAQTANDPNLIFALDEAGKIQRSTNGGVSWTTVSTIAGYSSQGGFNMAINISPINKDLILVGGVHGWRSSNGGTSWVKYLDGYWPGAGSPFFYVHSDHHDMKFVPNSNMVFSVNDGGIHRGNASLDTPWTDLSSGLAITQYYNVSGTPQNAGKLIAGAQDNDIGIYNGTTWSGQNEGTDGVEGLWDYSNENIAWSCSQAGFMLRTTNNFASTQQVTTPSGAPFVWELEIHPTVPTTIFGGFGDIYKSTNRGDSWTNLNSNAGEIEFISIAPSNPDIIWVSGNNINTGTNSVRKTTNGGTSWSTISVPQSNGNVKSIEVHPTNPNEVYIAYSGYLSGKVYKSTNGGVSWTNITGTLPNVPTHKILYRTGSTNGELFLATDLGVYYRTNTSGDWVKLSNGIPNVIVYDIEIHYSTQKIRAATFGRGVWEASISQAALGVDDTLPPNAITLYPNPTENKYFSLKLNSLQGTSKVMVYNIIGTVVKEFSTQDILNSIDLNNFSRGVYLVKVINNGKSLTKKLIVN